MLSGRVEASILSGGIMSELVYTTGDAKLETVTDDGDDKVSDSLVEIANVEIPDSNECCVASEDTTSLSEVAEGDGHGQSFIVSSPTTRNARLSDRTFFEISALVDLRRSNNGSRVLLIRNPLRYI